MVSLMHLVCITGLVLVSFVIFTKQEVVSASSSSDEEFHLEKRRIDGHSRTSMPLFRGSNLGIFVRKRPFAAIPEHSIYRRKESGLPSAHKQQILSEILNNKEQQRRFDDYSENPGPMFGR